MARQPLSIDNAFAAVRKGLTPEQHLTLYGHDLSWISIEEGYLRCRGCRDRVRLDGSLELIGIVCAAFVENHARCVRIVAKPGRAA